MAMHTPPPDTERPRVPLSHDSPTLLDAPDPGPDAKLPPPPLHDVLLRLTQQHEALLGFSDGLRNELEAAQVTVARLQASLLQQGQPLAAVPAPSGDGCGVTASESASVYLGTPPQSPKDRRPPQTEFARQLSDGTSNSERRGPRHLMLRPPRPERLVPPAAAYLSGPSTGPQPLAAASRQAGAKCPQLPSGGEFFVRQASNDTLSTPKQAEQNLVSHVFTRQVSSEAPSPQERGSVPMYPSSAESLRPPGSEAYRSQMTDDPGADAQTSQGVRTLFSAGTEASTGSGANYIFEDDFQKNAVYRLHARLGLPRTKGLVTPRVLADAVKALGLDTYTKANMEYMIRAINERAHGDGFGFQGDTLVATPKPYQLGSIGRHPERHIQPRLAQLKKSITVVSLLSDEGPKDYGTTVEVRVFVQALLSVDNWCLEGPLKNQILIIKEVLFSGDANKMVAELTQVRVDDLAAPMPKQDFQVYLEPAVGVMIFLNGISIGLQTDDSLVDEAAWMYVDMCFTLFFLFEVFLRIWSTGLRQHFFGPEYSWNVFDAIIVLLSSIDTAMAAVASQQGPSTTSSLSLMRVIRLTRLTRLFRIFRLKYMRELSLMVKGLLGGLKTLFWAIVLLFFTIYMIAVLMTTCFSTHADVPAIIKEDELFASVPRSMFTAFRCFLGDCTTSEGEPIVLKMEQVYGEAFVLGYFASMMFVVFGIFNLVIAVYIENTIDAAKRNKDRDKKHRQRESLRIAHITKRLLKKFCTAHRQVGALVRSETIQDVRRLLRSSDLDDVEDLTMNVSRELFLNVIQDPEVQWLMNELDIPPDRADLFDILDADGNGGLEVTELIQGLLRVRGDAKKSDIIATLLATRALQEQVRRFKISTHQLLESVLAKLGVSSAVQRGADDVGADKSASVELGFFLLPPAQELGTRESGAGGGRAEARRRSSPMHHTRGGLREAVTFSSGGVRPVTASPTADPGRPQSPNAGQGTTSTVRI